MTAAPNVPDIDRAHPERTRALLALMPILGVVALGFCLGFGLGTTCYCWGLRW